MGLREVVLPGTGWVLGNGRKIKFWKDKWLGDKPLLNLVTTMVPMGELEMHAQDMWRDGVGWDLSRIEPYVPQTVRLRLMSVVVDRVTGASDRMSWSESSDGMFTVRSAYQMLTRDEEERPNMEKFFTRVWRLLVPERVRVFLWLATHQVLMTNVERRKRHLSDSGLCQVCKSGEETILHILRDCPAMEGIWRRLVPRGRLQSFFAKSLLEWLHHNMGDERVIGGNLWATIFGLATWWGWKWRCGNAFGVNGKCRDRVRFIKELATEVSQAFSVMRGAPTCVIRVERQIAWSPPSEGWIKLNTDGASRGNPGLASAGGVLRDGSGVWRGGFALNIGICSAPLAELWGVYYGLYIA